MYSLFRQLPPRARIGVVSATALLALAIGPTTPLSNVNAATDINGERTVSLYTRGYDMSRRGVFGWIGVIGLFQIEDPHCLRRDRFDTHHTQTGELNAVAIGGVLQDGALKIAANPITVDQIKSQCTALTAQPAS
jgi:hypothetical protein